MARFGCWVRSGLVHRWVGVGRNLFLSASGGEGVGEAIFCRAQGGTFFSLPEGVFICTNRVIIAMSLSVGSIYNGYIGLCHKTNLILLSKC